MNNVAEAIRKKNTENINNSDVDLTPVGPRVIFKVYPDNPYRQIQTTEEGVIFGLEGSKKHMSSETGEIEEDMAIIVCAKIIAAGDACKWVHTGDEVFLCKRYATPLPFRNKHYFMTDENNVMCVINKI